MKKAPLRRRLWPYATIRWHELQHRYESSVVGFPMSLIFTFQHCDFDMLTRLL
jgi:hypothetical protein